MRGLPGRLTLPWPIHVAAVLLLALTATVRFYPKVSSQAPRTDERVYLAAFRAVSAGESPYAAKTEKLAFYYPPPFAVLGSAALELTDGRTVVTMTRTANLLGLASCLWCAFLFLPLGWRWRLAAGILYISLAPPALAHGFRSGNLSFAVGGAALVALVFWRRSALPAGALLALAAITKPIAPVGLTTLAAHRPSLGGRRHLLAAATGLALAGAATLASPYLGEYLALDGDVDAWPLRRSVSLYRWLHLLGLTVPPAVLVLIVALATAWLARRYPITPRQLYVLAIAGMTLATPALWSHTLILTLPLQVMALHRAWRRSRSRALPASRFARYELPLVALAVLALQLADGIGGGLEVAAAPLQVVALAIPVWAPVGLAIYLWRPGTAQP